MENRENKIISDKINSLDYLPEGYNPNLEAKWALLQSKEQKVKPMFFFQKNTWMKIAACLLILLISGIAWMNRTLQPKSEVATSTFQPHIELKEKVGSKTEKIANNTFNLPNNKKSSGKKVKIVVPIKEQLPAEEEQIAIIPQIIDSTKSLSAENNTSITIAKTKKSRYVQVDFEDAVAQPTNKNTFAQGFQFRLGLKSSTITEQNSINNSSIKLKRNF